MIVYELGTADVGLASAGYNARAQDASTVFTNPAGMTRLEGTQILAAGQVLWANTEFSIESGTSPALGGDDGDHVVGSDGWFPGGSAFVSYTLNPELKAGFALAGSFGGPLKYDDDWVGRYYVQETDLIGLSLLPSIAWKVNDSLSLGASLNAVYGFYKNVVAINNVDPLFSDGELKLEDESWGWGANLGLLYEFDADTRLGLTWNSQVNLDFKSPMEWSNLAPGVSAALDNAGLLNSSLSVDINVPQQVMGSVFTQLNSDWALVGSVGWQDWSEFGQIQLGINNATNPGTISANLDFKDTWHFAAGAQHRLSDGWQLNFGIAYDSGFQSGDVSPLLPLNSAWRFGIGGEQALGKAASWGIAFEYLYGGSLDTNLQSQAPVALGGRGNLVGSYNDTATYFLAGYYNWKL